MTKPIISFIVLVLSIGFVFFYIMPAYNESVKRRGNIENLSKTLSTSSEIKTLIEATKTNLGSIKQSELDKFEVFLPEKIDTIRFANNIQNIGRKNRITLSDIKVDESVGGASNSNAVLLPTASKGLADKISLGAKIDNAEGIGEQSVQSKPSTAGEYATTKASFIFTSTFETFQSFLDDLERSLGVIDVTSLSFSLAPANTSGTSPKKTPPPTYLYTMEIETYSLK